ncbi:SDR family oxidoreductase [Winogradskya humida]|uniref:NAD(P)-dependent oxidoreductase n=1 Tax=Winogradskya humida TaxID=113566 RepID=A0ABQ3ZTY8_9ACTN|nr:SDR family oxidoreductase [Actinoplanes humidus]GIE22056.1 NAD(P)-dependent oxidoreductase [Actinoplanes humidus]
MPQPVAITGATGQLGGRVARRLAAANIPQTLLVRDPSRAPQLPGCTVLPAAFTDHDAVIAALTGVPTALMVSASETPDRVAQHQAFIDAAAAAGVQHLVYISFFGAAPDATFTLARDHWATEQHIRASGMRFTFLRDNLYADFMPALAGLDGVIRGPAGTGRAAMVAQDDIADAAAAVLTSPAAHAGRTYNLTGPDDVSLADVAALLGPGFTYHPETVEEAYRSRAIYNAPSWQLDAWVSTYTAIADGSLAGPTTDIATLTGHPPTPLKEVLNRAA